MSAPSHERERDAIDRAVLPFCGHLRATWNIYYRPGCGTKRCRECARQHVRDFRARKAKEKKAK